MTTFFKGAKLFLIKLDFPRAVNLIISFISEHEINIIIVIMTIILLFICKRTKGGLVHLGLARIEILSATRKTPLLLQLHICDK